MELSSHQMSCCLHDSSLDLRFFCSKRVVVSTEALHLTGPGNVLRAISPSRDEMSIPDGNACTSLDRLDRESRELHWYFCVTLSCLTSFLFLCVRDELVG